MVWTDAHDLKIQGGEYKNTGDAIEGKTIAELEPNTKPNN